LIFAPPDGGVFIEYNQGVKHKHLLLTILLTLIILSCTVSGGGQTASPTPASGSTSTSVSSTVTFTAIPVTETFTPSPTITFTPLPTETMTSTPRAVAESLDATVTAERLSCRYGPGPDYLYLFAFRATAKIKLIGRVDADNWHWVLVENQVPCWVSTFYLDIAGDVLNLPTVYPDTVKLPITPYYPPSQVLHATRTPNTNNVQVSWVDVPVSLGDYEDDSMQTYIIELWRCEGGQLIFDPLATRTTFVSFVDEPGCSGPSHGRVFVQEKHGYAGPAEIPWPVH
jgi:hypothetical protein